MTRGDLGGDDNSADVYSQHMVDIGQPQVVKRTRNELASIVYQNVQAT